MNLSLARGSAVDIQNKLRGKPQPQATAVSRVRDRSHRGVIDPARSLRQLAIADGHRIARRDRDSFDRRVNDLARFRGDDIRRGGGHRGPVQEQAAESRGAGAGRGGVGVGVVRGRVHVGGHLQPLCGRRRRRLAAERARQRAQRRRTRLHLRRAERDRRVTCKGNRFLCMACDFYLLGLRFTMSYVGFHLILKILPPIG